MSVSVQEAARHLLAQLSAPLGHVNTLGQRSGAKFVIRVLVDSDYWYRLGPVPMKYEGFEVKVERRGATSPSL